MLYTTKKDAQTELQNSGYVNWVLSLDEEGREVRMTDKQESEIASIMWMDNLCCGCAVREWLSQQGEDLSLYDDLPDSDHNCEEVSED